MLGNETTTPFYNGLRVMSFQCFRELYSIPSSPSSKYDTYLHCSHNHHGPAGHEIRQSILHVIVSHVQNWFQYGSFSLPDSLKFMKGYWVLNNAFQSLYTGMRKFSGFPRPRTGCKFSAPLPIMQCESSCLVGVLRESEDSITLLGSSRLPYRSPQPVIRHGSPSTLIFSQWCELRISIFIKHVARTTVKVQFDGVDPRSQQ
ncbi:hypothetical protein B0J11DRAFT_503061 [Dendryphion nanum]|uniref:Uncharacterized protein n=1 Tax=Dendryphion nanum TaxID=256645 RepID=A0A9P9E732_9PLEO|nr:hypothetical protein B0J11DRAFT_503061 [Dendryphion nanum]